MGARESPAGSDGVLVDTGVQVLGERDDFLPGAVFFDLRSGYQRGVAACIERRDYFIQRGGIRRYGLAYLADQRPTGRVDSSRPLELK